MALAVAIASALAAGATVPNVSDGVDPFPAPPLRSWLWAGAGLAAATVAMLHTQIAAMSSVPDYGDPLLSSWRLAWFAHALPHQPWRLFDANIYFPATRTLAYSDATLVESALAAPALWLGAPLIVVYNGLVVASFFAAGLAMFALAYGVTRRAGAAFIAALVFGFDPVRFSEYTHLELLVTCFMPLALLALLRAFATGRRRHGAAAGLFLSLQALSSLYYGAYLAVSLAAVAVAWIASHGWPSRRTWTAIGIAAIVPAAVAGILTTPYRANRATVGERGDTEIRFYSATPAHYLTSSRASAVYGERLLDRRPDGLNLFPGTLPVVVAIGAMWPPIAPVTAAAATGLLASVDASFGLNGTIYSWLNHLGPFHGFRVPGRFRAVAGMYLALLAGLGLARIRSRRWRGAAVAIAVPLLLFDVHPTLELREVWHHGPEVYAHAPANAVVADLPLYEDSDSVFAYLSTFHWHPLVNGSSGFEPPWYHALATEAASFPDDRAIDALRHAGAEFVVLHEAYYRAAFDGVSAAADRQARLAFVAESTWEEGRCRMYRIVR